MLPSERICATANIVAASVHLSAVNALHSPPSPSRAGPTRRGHVCGKPSYRRSSDFRQTARLQPVSHERPHASHEARWGLLGAIAELAR
ncbi:hypothetical protein K525DRAFT_160071, partial [Schizophyllum commune Loenen D]